jgi:lipopolysaccharide export system permease protein
MPLLYKYWLKEFLKYFFITQSIILIIFVFIDYMARMERFLNSDISLFEAFNYVLLKLPFMFVQFTPAAILLAATIVFGVMNRNNEILAIRSGGINAYCLMIPGISIAFILGFIMFFLGETVIPAFNSRVSYIENNIIRKNQNVMTVQQQNIWIKSNNRMIRIGYYDTVQKTAVGITITELGENFIMLSRIDAQKAYYKDGAWILENITQQDYSKDTNNYEVKTYDNKSIDLALNPEELGAVTKKSEEMSFFELRSYVNKVAIEGYDPTRYKVDLNGKIAFPFICLVMILAGLATGMHSFTKKHMPLAVALGVVIAFMYWIVYGFCLSLGYAGILPPFISAWLTNVFFLGFGAIYLMNSGLEQG